MSRDNDQLYPETAPLMHHDRSEYRQANRRKYVIFITTLPLFFHVFFVTVTALFVLLYLNERNFGIEHRDRYEDMASGLNSTVKVPFFKRWTPLQVDVITALSVLLVSTRFFLAIWCADVVWKSIFILLERTGLSVSQITHLIQYKVLLGSGLGSSHHPKGVRVDHILVALVLLLPFPAYFVSPIITGAITWVPSYELFPSRPVENVSAFTSIPLWTTYQVDPYARGAVVAQAGKYYNRLYTTNRSAHIRRTLLAAIARQLPDNSTINNITIPYISLSNLTWVTDMNQVPSDQVGALDPNQGWLNATGLPTGLYAWETANETAVLIPPKPWTPIIQYDAIWEEGPISLLLPGAIFPTIKDPPPPLPKEEIISQQFYLAIWPFAGLAWQEDASKYLNGTENNTLGCTSLAAASNSVFHFPDTAQWYQPRPDHPSSCAILASLTISAGVKTCNGCRIDHGEIVTAADPHSLQDELRGDALVNEVFWLMPHVLYLMVLTGAVLPDEKSIDEYIRAMISRAYCATWSALTDSLSNETTGISVGANTAVSSVKATLSFPRIFAWIGLQALVWLGAIIFVVVERRCKRPFTGDTVIGLMFLDQSKELQAHAQHCGLSEVITVESKRHNKEIGLLKVKYDPAMNRSQLVQLRPRSASHVGRNA